MLFSNSKPHWSEASQFINTVAWCGGLVTVWGVWLCDRLWVLQPHTYAYTSNFIRLISLLVYMGEYNVHTHTVRVCLILSAVGIFTLSSWQETDRPVWVVAVSRRFLQPRSAELLEAEAEAEGRGFMLGPPWASARLPMVHAAALLASSSGLILKQSLAFGMTLLHHLGKDIKIQYFRSTSHLTFVSGPRVNGKHVF